MANYYLMGIGNVRARDNARRNDPSWQPPKPQPFVEGRDPYASVQRTPENNFHRVGKT
jgi:hypothetical protein